MESPSAKSPDDNAWPYDATLEDISEADWLAAAMKSEVFAFLADLSEDIYTLEDGIPYTKTGA